MNVHKLYQYYVRAVRTGTFEFRVLTSRLRCLPTALIVGAQKSGTSSLFSYLIQHPDVFGSFTKEVHYFDGGLVQERDNYAKGDGWYRAHFPFRFRVPQQSAIIEASPSYLFLQETVRRIMDMNPEFRILAVLRNPVERAISHYFHEVRAGRETRGLEEAIFADDPAEKFGFRLSDADFLYKIQTAYKSRGIYYPQVKNFIDIFGESQVYVIGSEQLFSAPNQTLSGVFRFLQVTDDVQIANLQARNTNQFKKDVPENVYQKLEAYYAPHNEKLFSFLGKRFQW